MDRYLWCGGYIMENNILSPMVFLSDIAFASLEDDIEDDKLRNI